jgi:hypothetical protein
MRPEARHGQNQTANRFTKYGAAGEPGMSEWMATMLRQTLLLIATALVVAGCGPAGPDVQLVEGVVTFDGEPFAGAAVAFTPTAPGGVSAAGKTDAEGRFRLNATQGKKYGQGTVVGDYVVTVTKLFWPEGATEPDHITPLIYENSKKSPLRATIVKGRNTFEFALTSKPAK